MKSLRVLVLLSALASNAAQAELIIADKTVPPQELVYEHPFLHFLVFTSPEARGQAILPPAPVFVNPPPLIWRAPGTMPPYPPPTPPGFNRPGNPSSLDIASYNLARAHAMSQNLYRRENGLALYFGPTSSVSGIMYSPAWSVWPYPPLAPGSSHPSNRDNASYLIERAHRFSQDAYRRP
ncbi:hypothetical protein [Sulfuricystis multivorans]|uniref:hypothetical protein n=1 Tax=Sulfuricystis multivorans TaxID=2211108 RepID=UPI000F819B78|nr:hypothetical protein [Sulfuricystis multivorans]